jgi:hypothetical protein
MVQENIVCLNILGDFPSDTQSSSPAQFILSNLYDRAKIKGQLSEFDRIKKAIEMMGAFLTKSSRHDSGKEYVPIPNPESGTPENHHSREKRGRLPKGVVMVSLAAVLVLLIPVTYFLFAASTRSGAFNHTSLPIQHDDKGTFIACPEDPSSARKSGCSFDLLANGWIPDPCFDATMHHDFVDGKDYGFFEDRNGEHRVHQNTVMEGDNSRYPDGLWVTFEEHHTHCRYLVNGSIRAVSRPHGAFLDVYLDRDHMMHCYGVLGEHRNSDHIETYVKAFFESRKCYVRD